MKRELTIAAMFLIPTTVGAQVVTQMTPALIGEALTWGATQKDAPFYRLKGPDERIVTFDSPFARVAVLGYSAKRDYKTVDAASVDAVLLEPYVSIHARPYNVRPIRSRRARVVGVRKVIVTGPKGSNPIQPLVETVRTNTYGNALGAEWQANSMTAKFPLEVLRPDAEVHVLYEDGDDITFRFDLDEVR
jgi:hypothetical protein